MRRYAIIFEKSCLLAGAALVLLAVLVAFDGVAHSRAAVEDFEQARRQLAESADQSLWSEQRKTAYRRSLDRHAGTTLAVLRIPSVGIEVPVYDSIGETALNRGTGHVQSTAMPDEQGNIAIAGHRDGFFRGLKDIEVGAGIELETLEGSRRFRVTSLDIVDPLDVSVLDASDATVLTLITCYPFYYAGPAPDRFIVRAELTPVNQPGDKGE